MTKGKILLHKSCPSSLTVCQFKIKCPNLQLDTVNYIKPVSFANILKWNAPEWKFYVLGCMGAALYGAYPFLYGIAFGEVLHVSISIIHLDMLC